MPCVKNQRDALRRTRSRNDPLAPPKRTTDVEQDDASWLKSVAEVLMDDCQGGGVHDMVASWERYRDRLTWLWEETCDVDESLRNHKLYRETCRLIAKHGTEFFRTALVINREWMKRLRVEDESDVYGLVCLLTDHQDGLLNVNPCIMQGATSFVLDKAEMQAFLQFVSILNEDVVVAVMGSIISCKKGHLVSSEMLSNDKLSRAWKKAASSPQPPAPLFPPFVLPTFTIPQPTV